MRFLPDLSVPTTHLSDADEKIVFDRYHLMGYLTKAVDTVRKQENRALFAAGDKSLAGSKYLWLYSAENLPARHQDRFTAHGKKSAPEFGLSIRKNWRQELDKWSATQEHIEAVLAAARRR